MHVIHCLRDLVFRELLGLLDAQYALILGVFDIFFKCTFVFFYSEVYLVHMGIVEVGDSLLGATLFHHLLTVLDSPEHLTVVVVYLAAKHYFCVSNVAPVLVELLLKTLHIVPEKVKNALFCVFHLLRELFLLHVQFLVFFQLFKAFVCHAFEFVL